MPWMKVLRKPRLNRTVVSVAVDTAASFARARSLKDMLGLSSAWMLFRCARFAPGCQTAVSFGIGAQLVSNSGRIDPCAS